MRFIASFILLFCLLSSIEIQAQNKKNNAEPIATLTLKLNATREVRQMLGYDSIYNALEPKVKALYMDRNGQYHVSYTYIPTYNEDKRYWYWDRLPYGICVLEVDNPAFGLIRDTMVFKNPQENKSRNLEPNPPLYTYQNNERIDYLCGALRFNNTLMVHFESGDPIKNREDLGKLLPEALRIQKTVEANVFYVTVPTLVERTTNELLEEKRINRKKGHEPIYIGARLTEYIEKIKKELPKVKYVNPTFYDNKPIEDKMYAPNKIKKSDKLVRKEMMDLSY